MNIEKEEWDSQSGLNKEEWFLVGKTKWYDLDGLGPSKKEWENFENIRIQRLSEIKENEPSLFSEIINNAKLRQSYPEKEYVSHYNPDAEDEINRIYKKYGMERRYVQIGLGDSWNYSNICMWFKDAGDLLKRTPTLKDFRYNAGILDFNSDEEKRMFMQLHYRIPNTLKKYFRSSKNAYRMALEFYEIGKKNKFGYTCMAEDGHKCNSLIEAEIDDFMFKNNILHEKEPHYPDSSWRADFKVNEYYIEYFGLTGNSLYDEKTKAKVAFAKEKNLKLIPIYPYDIKAKTWKEKLLFLKDV